MTSYPDQRLFGLPVDLDLGMRRARAAAMLVCGLPGSVYIYQGDELGLWEVEDIPAELRQDPTLARSGGADLGRDGSRVPLPWTGTDPAFGFSPTGSSWLPQPAEWRDLAVAAQLPDPGSHLSLYRDALRIRRATLVSLDDALTWLPAPEGVLAFAREPGFSCVVNFSSEPAELPFHRGILLASRELDDGKLPPDTAVWLRTN
jgi:alpha-glucosidase